VLESGRWASPRGEEAARWAAEFAAFQDARYGVALTNGTHSLETALAASEVGEGDEVIVPALTFVSTATAVLAVNGVPILVDVDPGSLCIDAGAAEAAITDRTRAIIAVHLAGRPCDLDALGSLCRKHDLVLIEDCAHAPGARWRGSGVGSFGSFGGFSFQESKLITAGEGGALITNVKELRARAWSYANCGRVENGDPSNHVRYGTNMRMTEWQAAVLRAQLQRFPEQHRIREERAALLDAELEKIPGLRPQSGDRRIDSRARFAYVFHYDPSHFAGLSLEGFGLALAREGIPIGRPYRSINTLELFREGRFDHRLRRSAPQIDYAALRLPRAEEAAESTVWVDQRVLLAPPDGVLDVVRAISRIRAHGGAIARRTSGPLRLSERVFRGARRRLSRSR
jgi:dTDP-4-amino-4,6-dideoxygalactose transaminase